MRIKFKIPTVSLKSGSGFQASARLEFQAFVRRPALGLAHIPGLGGAKLGFRGCNSCRNPPVFILTGHPKPQTRPPGAENWPRRCSCAQDAVLFLPPPLKPHRGRPTPCGCAAKKLAFGGRLPPWEPSLFMVSAQKKTPEKARKLYFSLWVGGRGVPAALGAQGGCILSVC